MRSLLLLILVSAAILHAPLGAVPQRQAEARLAKLQAWLETVESHAPARADAAALNVASASNRDLDQLTPYIFAFIDMLPPSPGILPREQRLSAVRLDPALVEARVRLARVTSLLGRHEEAARELRPLVSGEAPPTVRYFAALILGDVEQALGRRDAAADAFRLAASRPAAGTRSR